MNLIKSLKNITGWCLIGVSLLLAGCSGKCLTNNEERQPGVLNFTMSAPSMYPSGYNGQIPILITNNDGMLLSNIVYNITDNTTGTILSITPASAAACATLAPDQSCTLIVNKPASSSPGSFVLSVASDNKKTSVPVGLTQTPKNTATGIDGVTLYYTPSISVTNNKATTAIITMVVTSPNAGQFNTLKLVDSAGNPISYNLLSGNSGNGMTPLMVGDVVTLAVNVPSGATQLAVYPQLSMNNTVVSSASTPAVINILRSNVQAQATLSILPGNFDLDESNPTQMITVYNSGNSPASGLQPSVSAPMYINTSQSTCGNTLAAGASCAYKISFDRGSKVAGTSGVTLNYNSGVQNSSSTSIFTYRDEYAVVDLDLSSGSNPTLNFTTTVTNPITSSIVMITNNSLVNINNVTYSPLPSGFSVSTDGVVGACTPNLTLTPNQSCNVKLIYNNNSVVTASAQDLTVSYNYIDPLTSETHTGSGRVPVISQTVQSSASLSSNINNVNFGNVLANNSATQFESIVITNNGETATTSIPSVTFGIQNGIYSIANNGCNAPLAPGESCTIIVKSGPLPSSTSAETLNNSLNIEYIPYPGGVTNTLTTNLTTQAVTARSAIINATLTESAGFVAGNGTSANPFSLDSGSSGTLTYTVTNSSTVAATNFILNADAAALSPWTMSNNCSSTIPANSSCTVVYSLTNAQTGVNNLSVNNISMSWVDEDSPLGESQPFSSTEVYSTAYVAPTITVSPESVTLSSLVNTSSTFVTTAFKLTLNGHSPTNQNVSLALNTPDPSITIQPTVCVLSAGNPTCSYSVSTRGTAVGRYPLTISNAGTVPLSTNQLSITVVPFTTGLWGISQVKDGDGFLISGESGTLVTSTDGGNTWIERETGFDSTLWASTLTESGLYITVGQSSTILTSPDLITWTTRNSGGVYIERFDTITINPDGSIMTIGYAGVNATSSDGGYTWTTNNPLGTTTYSVAADNSGNYYGAAAQGRIYKSSNQGVSWVQSTPAAAAGNPQRGIIFHNGTLISVGYGGTIMSSTDGAASWTARTSGTSANLYGVAVNANGVYVVVGDSGTILRSIDGINWVAQLSGTSVQLRAVLAKATDNSFMAVGQNGAMLLSPDGITWTIINQ